MKNLLTGIIDFRRRVLPALGLDVFKTLAVKGQSPKSLFIGCADSRMVPNLFASTNPGELFVVRNVGNLVPRCCDNHSHVHNHGHHQLLLETPNDDSIGAAVEFSNAELKVCDVIVCGHSDCGAMKGLISDDGKGTIAKKLPHLGTWLKHGFDSYERLKQSNFQFKSPHSGKMLNAKFDADLSPANKLSQINVLQQIENLTSYEIIRERIEKGELNLHAWWFDIGTASVYSFSEKKEKFVLIDEEKALKLVLRSGEDRKWIHEKLKHLENLPAWILGEDSLLINDALKKKEKDNKQ